MAKEIIAGNLGNFLIQMKRYEEGIAFLGTSIKLNPNYAKPYLAMGGALAEIGQKDEAIKFLEKAVLLGEPNSGTLIEILKNSKNDFQEMADTELTEKAKQEIILHLNAKRKKDGVLSKLSVINESVMCLAVNTILTIRNFRSISGEEVELPQNTFDLMLKGHTDAFDIAFPKTFGQFERDYIIKNYNILMKNVNRIDIINTHYNELYGYDGRNVL